MNLHLQDPAMIGDLPSTGEPGLFILWEHCTLDPDTVSKMLTLQFDGVKHLVVTWAEDSFLDNLKVFYGANLPSATQKMEHVGTGSFHVFLFHDPSPVYAQRETSRGPEHVNVNLFDLKTVLRDLDGGGHRVHGTINAREGKRDCWLLFGKSVDEINPAEMQAACAQPMKIVGQEGFDSLRQLLHTLNLCVNYVVMRNFDSFPDNYDLSLHGDIDILTDNLEETVRILGARKQFDGRNRVAYVVWINGEWVPFDIRFVGDNYFDEFWQIDMLRTRQLERDFFVPEPRQHFFSLCYHALFHKPALGDDYRARLIAMSNAITGRPATSEQDIDQMTRTFMLENGYNFTFPNDETVQYQSHKTKSIDQHGYLKSLISRMATDGGIDPSYADTHARRLYEELNAGKWLDPMRVFSAQEPEMFAEALILAPPVNMDTGRLDQLGSHVTLVHGSEEQRQIFDDRYASDTAYTSLTVNDWLQTETAYDRIMIPQSIDLFPSEVWHAVIEKIAAGCRARTVIELAYRQAYNINTILGFDDPVDRYNDEHRLNRARSINTITFDFAAFLGAFTTVGFEMIGDYGLQPTGKRSAIIIQSGQDPETLNLADMLYPSLGTPVQDQSNLFVALSSLGKQMDLATVLQGRIVRLQRQAGKDSARPAPVFAKCSMERADAFKTLTIATASDGQIRVGKHRSNRSPEKEHAFTLLTREKMPVEMTHLSNFEVPFVPGHSLGGLLEHAVYKNNAVAFAEIVEIWCQQVKSEARIIENTSATWKGYGRTLIEGRFFDLGPHNLMCGDNGLHFIDMEWVSRKEIPMIWFLYRNCHHSRAEFQNNAHLTWHHMLAMTLAHFGEDFTNDTMNLAMELESTFQKTVSRP